MRSSGLKLTPQRLAIVRELAADPTHPTAQELFERLRPTLPTMSFATVYNTLDALASAGLCVALSLSPGASRFDPNMEAHHHAVCDRCGLVRDVPCEPSELSAQRPDEIAPAPLMAAPGFEVRAVERIYRGLCAACAKGKQGDESAQAAEREAGRSEENSRLRPAGARGARRPERG
ncbi:Fur family transcriptional regulator [Sorangium sp. So ce1078]|uniref:Fur family transcriptional regulator n=1 Tax=Sorangium sp. So ce1078 TaxID=3133329 RepID=UPI003F634F3C